MVNLIRWLLVVPSIFAAWYAAILIGLTTHAVAERLCPRDQMISGHCAAPWFVHFENLVIHASVALAAALILFSAAIVAPNRRSAVIRAVLFAGIGVATWMGLAAGAYSALVVAVIAGAMTARLLLAWSWLHG